MQPLQVCKDDVPNLGAWLEKSQDQFTSPAIQNEMLEIMATTMYPQHNFTGKLLSIIVHETTDVPNTEQLVFCIRYVDDQLKSREEYTGLHSLDFTTAPNTSTIEDILLLQLQNCRGQCYNRASTMAGCKTGVATTIL